MGGHNGKWGVDLHRRILNYLDFHQAAVQVSIVVIKKIINNKNNNIIKCIDLGFKTLPCGELIKLSVKMI